VDFNASKVIDEIDVFSVQDVYNSPSEPTLAMTFSTYSLTTFQAQYWNGSAWVTVPNGNITGNNRVWKQIAFSPVTTNKIRIWITGSSDGYSRMTEVEAWGTSVPVTRQNVAASANGGTATASQTNSAPYSPSGAINGDRKLYLNNNAWANSTATFPQWLQVDFNGSKDIDEIDVFSVQDVYNSPNEPTLAMTFSAYGLTAFQAQYWNGSAWLTVPNGSITGNNNVWKQITFSPITTSKIRIWITGSSDGYSRMTEVEAWGVPTGSGGSSGSVQWLISDHLGTPRMVLDQTGSLANLKRHDYLPFGEELVAPTGGRNATQGYAGGDGVRQQFTQKERDVETALDYFEARYYSSNQGRFTSADSVRGFPHHPQSLNLYSYTMGNPLRFIDPSGNTAEDPHGEQIDKPKDGCGTDKGSLCLWKGQDPPKRTGQPPTPIGTNGEILTDEDVLVIDAKPAFPGLPSDNPGETPFERYAFSPKQTALEVVDWASKGVRKFGYAIAPDYVFLNFGVPLVASGSLQYSKDRQWYYSFAGPTAGAKNFKVGGQLGIAYFATTQMKPEQRDAASQGPGLNVTTPFTPVGAYFPSSGRPAITLGWPFSAGVNGSKTWRW
jgi:RHS repeat-associated protein